MNKILMTIISILCIAFGYSYSHGEKMTSYVDEVMSRSIILKKDSVMILQLSPVYFFDAPPEADIFKGDTIYSGKYKDCGCGFIEISPDLTYPFKDMRVSYSTGYEYSDSVKIIFNIPMTDHEIDICINVNNGRSKTYIMEYTKSNDYIYIPKTNNPYILNTNTSLSVGVYVKPNHNELELYGNYLGQLYYHCFEEINVPKDCAEINISIPGLNNNILNKLFTNGEFMKIENNKLLWRGKAYMQVKE